MFSNMKIGTRLTLGFSSVVLLLIAIAVIGLTSWPIWTTRWKTLSATSGRRYSCFRKGWQRSTKSASERATC